MKKLVVYLVFLLITSFFTNNKSYASHAAGGEISYEWVSDSTYRLYFKFYRDCTGSGEPGNVTLCYRNTCNNLGNTVTLNKINKLPDSTLNGSPVSLGCPGTGTKCTNTSSIVPSYREWWYTNTITISRCSLWRFTVAISTRNASVNLSNAGTTNFFIEATLNNQVAQGNSSPFFSVKPVPSVCINKPYTYNNGAVDPNSDSLVFEMLQPLQGPLTCPSGGPTSTVVSFDPTGSPSYNITNNPIQTGNSFALSSTTGQMTFTPTLSGAGTISIRVKEYRNGVLIGSVMRDVQVQVINCAVASPIVNTVSGSLVGAVFTNGRVEACAGVPFSFCFDLKSTDTAAIIVASDNHAASAPGSSVNYIGQRTDSVRGCLNWTPGTLDTGLRVFSVTAKDSTCLSPGVIVAQTFVLPIYIWPITDIIKDTAICKGDSVQLLAVGGSQFTWSVLAGGSPITTLSCTTCKQPYAKPTILTRYVVVNSSASYCNKNSDTVTINVNDFSATVPVANGNGPLCSGQSILLTANALPAGFGYLWTGPLSYSSTTQNPTISNSQVTHTGNYILRGTKSGCYTSADTVSMFINQTPSAPVASSNTPICAGSQLNLFATTVSGAIYSWSGPNTFSSSSQNPTLTNPQSANAGNYSVTATVNGCTSVPSNNAAVVINPIPFIASTGSTNPGTCAATTGSITLSGLNNSTSYTVNYKKNGVPQTPVPIATNGSGVLTIGSLGQGTYSQITVTYNGCTSDTTAPIVLSDPNTPTIILSSSSNPTTCLGSNGSITIGGLTNGTTYTINYKKNTVGQTPLSLTASGSGTVTISNLTAGSYTDITATVTNCTSNILGTILLTNPSAPVISASNNTPVCQGDTIKLFASGPVGTTYIWSGPNSFSSAAEDTMILNGVPAQSGTYSVTGTLNNCTSTPSTTIVLVRPTPTTPVAGSNTPLCSGDTLLLTSTTVTNATYSWTGPATFTSTSQNPSIPTVDTFKKGTYNVRAIVDGCPSLPGSTLVAIYHTPEIDTYSYTHPTTCSGTEGSIRLKGLISSTNYTVNYKKNATSQTPLLITSNGLGEVVMSGLSQGVYTQITVTLNNCASDTIEPIILTDPTIPVITFSAASNPTTCLGSNGSITIAGLTNGVSYSINYTKNGNPQTSFSQTASASGTIVINNLTAGIYAAITATVNNCTSNALNNIVLSNPSAPVISASNNTPICQGDTIKLFASGPVGTTYIWSGPNSFTSATEDTMILNSMPLQSGTYSVTGTLNNCVSTPSTTIVTVKPTPITPVAGNNGPLCSGDTLHLNASTITNATYSWTGPVAFASNSQNPSILNVDTFKKGTYTVIATVDGCPSLPGSTIVAIFHTPEIDTYSYMHPTTCSGTNGSITLKGVINNTSYTVNYRKNGISQTPVLITSNNSGEVVMSGLSQGVYTQITITLNNCPSDTVEPIVLTDPSLPVISSGNNTPICQGDTIKLFASGPVGTTYVWSGPNAFTSLSEDTMILNSIPSQSGTYTVIGTLNNCASLPSTTTVVVKPTPITPVAGNNGPLCSGSTLNLTSSTVTNATYSWTGPGTYISAVQNPTVTSVDTFDKGNYSVIATIDGCPSLPAVTNVVIYHTPEIDTYSFSNPTTCQGTEGSITLTGLIANTTYAVNYLKNGAPQATASLNSNLSGNLIINGLAAGTYSQISITLNGCVSDTTHPIILSDPNPPVITGMDSTDPATCLGTEGTITLKGLTAGKTYAVNYTKNTIAQTPLNITANISGDVVITGLSAGTYDNINVTLDNCISNNVGSIGLSDPLPPTVSSSNNTPICQADTVKLFAVSVPGVTYSWTGPNSFVSAAKDTMITPTLPAQSGNYIVTATLNNCTSAPDTTYVLVYPTPPSPNAANNGPLCTGNTLNLTSDTITGATYSWTGPVSYSSNAQNPVIGNVTTAVAGTYTVIATVNGCVSPSSNTTVLIYPPLAPIIGSLSIVHPSTCGGTDGSITLTGLMPDSSYLVSFKKNNIAQTPVSLQANNIGTLVITALGQGLYDNIRVTLNICSSDPVGPVTLNDPLPPVVIVSNNTPVCQKDTVKLFASSAVGVTYSWTGPNGFTSLSEDTIIADAQPLHSGVYSVTGTLNNCTSNPFTTTVIVHSTPATPVAGSNSPLCPGDVLNLTASAVTNATYKWTGPLSYTSNTQNPSILNVNPNHTGDYIVTATVNNCVSLADTISVIVHPTPVIASVNASHPVTCSGTEGSITLNGLLPNTVYIVNYKKNGIGQPVLPITSGGTGSVVIPNLAQGLYTQITVTLNGCISDTTLPLWLYDPLPPVISAYNNTPICQGDTIKLYGTGVPGVLYTWIGPNTFTSTDQNPKIPNAQLITAGIYSVTGTLANCTSAPVTTTVIIKPTPPKPTAANNGPLCEGYNLTLTASTVTGATYKWGGPLSFTSTNQNPGLTNVNPSNGGKYFVTATVNGCPSAADTTNVIVHPYPALPGVTPVVYCQFATATALTATGNNLKWYTQATGGTASTTAPIPLTTIPGTFTWWVSQTDINGCEGLRSAITVKVNPQPIKPLVTTPLVYCQLETALPLAAIGQNLMWYTQATGGTASTITPTPSTAVAGTFTWWVSQTDANGCESDRAVINVLVKPKPQPPAVTSLFYCDGDAASALTAGGQNLMWYTQATGGVGIKTPPVPSTTDTGTTDYYVSQTVDGCESDRALLTVRVNQHVTADIIIEKDVICQHDTLMVGNVGTNPSTATYAWDFNGAEIISGTNEGPYWIDWTEDGNKKIRLTVSNLNCIDSSEKSVEVIPAPDAIFQLNEHACVDEELEIRTFWDYGNVTKYTWSFDGATISDTTIYSIFKISWPTPGTKTVRLITTGKNGCLSKPRVNTTVVHDKPVADILSASRNDICTRDTIMFKAAEYSTYTYEWTPAGHFLHKNKSSEVEAVIPASGFIYLNVVDEWKCTNTDSMLINTQPCCNAYLPSAFTPNGDGKNDVFRIITIGHHEIINFIVVNRWGQEIFMTKNEQTGWDGKFKGVPQEIGTYHYYLKFKCSDGKIIEMKGEVLLVK